MTCCACILFLHKLLSYHVGMENDNVSCHGFVK